MAFGRNRADRRGTPADLLVVGLGNPGSEYAGTRHNVGSEVAVLLAERHGGRLRTGKERALVDELRIGGSRVAVAFPQTFMNLSGESVRLLAKRFGVEDPEQLVVVHDEIDLPLGRLRVKRGGGLAGHNGLRSIRDHLHTTDFLRVRIGVGRPSSPEAGADYLTKRRPTKAERTELEIAVQSAADAVESILADGADAAMAEFNGR
ncbi:MAG: aminoacyl-tRNA hydrolase [Actinomycetota bacterium]|nr:aminoacyl-tRNA hydrolase [Actinomycetota bacterium]